MKRLTVVQVAERLERSEALVRRWLRAGVLRGELLGRMWFVTERELERFKRHEPERRQR